MEKDVKKVVKGKKSKVKEVITWDSINATIKRRLEIFESEIREKVHRELRARDHFIRQEIKVVKGEILHRMMDLAQGDLFKHTEKKESPMAKLDAALKLIEEAAMAIKS